MRPCRISIAVPSLAAVLVACSLFSSVLARDTPALAIQAHALDSRPQSRVEADEAMDGAVAASMIGAISTQFGDRAVAVKLQQVAVLPTSVRDRMVSGLGRLQIGDDTSWIPFRFNVLYDTRTASATHPAISLGEASAAHEIALDSTMARELDHRVGAALVHEFAQQPVQLLIERVTTANEGRRYLRIEALGMADFGSEGRVPTQVQALYDRKTGEWVRLDYELGTTANWADPGDAIMATR